MGKKGKSRKSKNDYSDPGLGFSPYQQQKGMAYSPDKTAESRKVRRSKRDEIDDALDEFDDYTDILAEDEMYDDDDDFELDEYGEEE